jgi:hypothetical protein
MRKAAALGLGLIVTGLGPSGVAGAAVLIKTFQFAICVTGAKHPDACKNSGADASVVVSDEAMEGLDGKIGQGASIVALAPKGAIPRPNDGDHHRHAHQGAPPADPQ